MYDFLLTLQDWHAMEILFILGVALILIDYFFPVDYPAYLGYFCFAAGMFFALPFTVLPSILIALGIFAVLLLLHRVWFSRYLTNAPSAEARRAS